MSLLSVSGAGVRFGARTVLRDVTFTVERGERWGILGRNGSGKTSLFALIRGTLKPEAGGVSLEPHSRVVVMDQHRDFGDARTVWDAAAGPFAELLALERELAEQAAAIGAAGERADPALLARYDRGLERFDREGGWAIAARVDAVLDGLGFDPEDARARPLATLSGGERGRVGLARQLAAPADLLLLDEPTNHLDLDTVRWLEGYLRGVDAAVLLVSHDRALLDALTDHTLHLEAQTARAYPCGYAAFVGQRAERRLAEQRAFTKQAAAVAKEEDYIRRNLAGQNSRQAVGRRRRLERLPRLAPPPGEDGVMAPAFAAAVRGGDQVLVAEGVRVAVGDRVLLDGFGAIVRRGEVIGLAGANGAGKTTLLDVLTGVRAPQAGRVAMPGSVRAAVYRQDLAQVPRGGTLYDVIAGVRTRWSRGQVQGHLGRFGFSGDAVLRRTDSLSGGELARVALALMTLADANLLVFDEPTNHLDVEAVEVLEDAIAGFEGTVILVSHDRALLRALTTRVWVLHGGHITDYPGGFAQWEVASAERAHAARVAVDERDKLRQVQEKQRLRRAHEDQRAAQAVRRTARQQVEAAERAVADCESRVAAIEARLADPALYGTPDGVRDSAELGRELEIARAALDRAFETWGRATAALESLG